MRSRAANLLPWIGIVAGAEFVLGAAYGWLQYVRAPSLRLGTGFPDFLLFYSVARFEAVHGFRDLYAQARLLPIEQQITGGAAVRPLPLTSPPYLAVAFRPLALTDFRSAYIGWACLTAVVLGLGIFILVRTARLKGKQGWAIGLLAAAWLPTAVAVLQGQLAGLTLLGAAIFSFGLWTNTGARAGAGALLTLVRPHLVLLVPLLLLVRQKWLALGILAAGVALAFVATLPLVGLHSWVVYTGVLTVGIAHGNQGFANSEQAAYVIRGLADTTGAPALDVVLPLVLLIGTAFLITFGRAARLDASLALAVSLESSLHSNLHDLTLLLAAMIPLAGALLAGEARFPVLGWAALGVCYFLVDGALFSATAAALGGMVLVAYLVFERVARLRHNLSASDFYDGAAGEGAWVPRGA